MKIVFTGITKNYHSFNVDELVVFLEEGVELTTDVEAKLVVSQQEKDVYCLRGNLKAQVLRSCGRCGKIIQYHIDEDFQYQFLVKEEPQLGSEYQCNSEDCELLYLAEPEVESGDIL
jgi:uncharacterized metal-binding protein YceD (DUF177 family)